jgi:hypothetical protein
VAPWLRCEPTPPAQNKPLPRFQLQTAAAMVAGGQPAGVLKCPRDCTVFQSVDLVPRKQAKSCSNRAGDNFGGYADGRAVSKDWGSIEENVSGGGAGRHGSYFGRGNFLPLVHDVDERAIFDDARHSMSGVRMASPAGPIAVVASQPDALEEEVIRVANPQKRADRSVANPAAIRRHRTLNQVRQRQDAARRAPVASRGTSNSSHAPPAINPPPDGVAGFACHICVRMKLQYNARNVIQHASTQHLEFLSEFTDERMRFAARTTQDRVTKQLTIRARTNLLRRPKQLPLDSARST